MPRTSNAARINPATRPRRFTSIDLLHHQRGIGSAEAEAVVEHCANLPLSGLVRDQVDALGALVGFVEVERGRGELVAHGEDAEDRFDRARDAQQGIGRASCWERVCSYWEITVVGGNSKQKNIIK